MSRRSIIALSLLVAGIIVLFWVNLLVGSVDIPVRDMFAILTGNGGVKDSWRFIVMESRLPQAMTALLSGAALAVSGLLLQTAFHNPLAGPDVFGINSGAGLG
ncbi:MAG: iron chelate uptake ABC transporter family permease subunit, partial [Prevotella sp.]|nr:iron chelate uptake ABC transporter family permease subunit [Prevotella sp.]